MLNNKDIEKAILNKEIEITITFEMEDDSLIKYEKEKELLSSSLNNNLYSDRLKLTMGPIVKVLRKMPVNTAYRYKNILYCHDLRKSNNKYIIKPGESIIVLTNERIKLCGEYACLIVPRISLSDVGVVVTTAYVDPYYNGIMRLHLSNVSDKQYELSLLESIAQCFFFKLSDTVSDEFKDSFSTKSVFFGQTWEGILDSDRNPFPTKKESASFDKYSNLKYQGRLIWEFIRKHSIIFLIVTNLIAIVGGLALFKQEFEHFTSTSKQIESILQPISSEILVDYGKMYGEKMITVDYAKADIVTVLCNNEEIHYKLMSSDVENKTDIIFSYSLESPAENQHEISFTYVVVRRVE